MGKYSVRLVATPGMIDLKTADIIRLLDRILFPVDEEVDMTRAYWWLIRDDKEKAIGFAGMERLGEDAVLLSRVGILRNHQGQGLQKRCIAVRETLAKRHGIAHVVTYTALDNLPSANNLIKCGYAIYKPSVLKKWLHFYKCLDDNLSREEIRTWQRACDLGFGAGFGDSNE